MKAEQLKMVVEKHKRFVDIPSRANVTYICQFVEDLLKAELKHIKESEPEAVVTIAELERTIDTVKDLWCDIEEMKTEDLVKVNIWN